MSEPVVEEILTGSSGQTLEESYKHMVRQESRYTSDGKAICRLCGYSDKDLSSHLKSKHSGVLKYQEEFPDMPIVGRMIGEADELQYPPRKHKTFSALETFGFLWNGVVDKELLGFEEPGPYTPEIDPVYDFPPEETQVILMGLHFKDRISIYGPSGVGKTSLIEQVCARLNYGFRRINLDGDISRSEIVGQWITKGREMVYCYGALIRAMAMQGVVICLDEWDAAGEGLSFTLQQVMEENSKILLLEKGEEVISLHKDNLIVATSNTGGMGDDTGLYAHGTDIQNFSAINRYSLTIEMDWPTKEREISVLKRRFPRDEERNKGLKDWEAEAIVEFANLVRSAFDEGNLVMPMTIRDSINLAEKYLAWGYPDKAAKYCLINRYPKQGKDRGLLYDLLKECFPM